MIVKNRKKLAGIVFGIFALLSTSAQAHLIYFGYSDNGDGTVDYFGQHYHSASQSTGSGLTFTDTTNTAITFTGLWNDTVASQSVNDMLATLTQGWDLTSGYSDTTQYNWLVSRNVSLANGVYQVSATNPTVVDTAISTLPEVTVTGVTPVPEPTSLAIFALALVGFAARRVKK
ncbi:MAG: PEP-CTERM sorting domain-containing protein [Colwellia sp.]|nr:PEP-CTERM sorting domain-containing protein [Colwellia sp.]